MADDHDPQDQIPITPRLDQLDEYEEITSEEVDRIVESLELLISQSTSENIRAYLEEAADNVYNLVYGEDEDSADYQQEEAA